MKNIIKILSVAAATLLAAQAVQAAKIHGEIFFASDGLSTLVGGNYQTATGITFGGAEVSAGTGDYSGIPSGTAATFTSFNFGSVGTTGALSVDPLWMVISGNTYAFKLTKVTLNAISGTARVIEGEGWASISGGLFENTKGTWQLSTSGTSAKVTFSSFTSVPDAGSSVLLLGIGIVGLAAVRRFRK